jgi:hypothetical protein
MIKENEYYQNCTRKQLVKVIKSEGNTLTYRVIHSDCYNTKTEFVNTKKRFENIYLKVNNPSRWS